MSNVQQKRPAFLRSVIVLICLVPFASPFALSKLFAQVVPGVVEAIAAEPYGVARLYLPAGQLSSTTTLRILVSDPSDRVMFPAIDFQTSDSPEIRVVPPGERIRLGNGELIGRLRSAIQNAKEQIDPIEVVRVQFLFRGSEPFQVRLSGDIETTLEVRPIKLADTMPPTPNTLSGFEKLSDAPPIQALIGSWWDGYVQQAKRQLERSDYPAIVESYLTHMLAYRYGFEVPELIKKKPRTKQSDPLPTLALVAGVEELRAEVFQETLRWSPQASLQMVRTPLPPKWSDATVPTTPEDLVIEPIAKVVPPECYYLRFASFSNYLWFQSLSETRGGDLAQMAVLRGFNYETDKRMERLLNTKTTAIAKLFGDSIVSDMAIIGQDLYLQEGPSLGVLFEAKNLALLRNSFNSDRTTAAKKFATNGCKLENIEISGTTVSFLSTPDNQIRSFMVERDQYIFVTSSRKLAERFIEVHGGEPSLADSKAFRFARLMMPLQNKYDIFVYLSSEFLRNLVSPQYQIELRRRLKALAAIEIAELASLTAQAETGIMPATPSIERLVEQGYLHEGFQTRVDGSQTISYSGAWHDSIRGRRGSFLPIADVQFTDCSAEEALAYRDQATFYATQWQQTDPLMVGIRRFSRNPNERIERLAIEAYVAPLGKEKYGWLSNMLAAPVRTQIQLPPDDVINCQAHLTGQGIGRTSAPDYVMFAGLKDMVPPVPGETKGLLATLRTMQSLPAYLGGWPGPGYLDRLPLGLGGGLPDGSGFSKLLIGVWRWQMNGFSVLSFDRSILDQCASWLKPVPTDDFAQARLMVGHIEKSKLSAWFNTFWFRRAAQTTRGNLMLLDSLQHQLKVPAADSLASAERILDAKLQCSLGGKYVLLQNATNPTRELWESSAWPSEIATTDKRFSAMGFDSTKCLPPVEYKAPWLQWFRGAKLHLTQLPERLIVVGIIDIEPLPPIDQDSSTDKSDSVLPKMDLDLFNLPFQFFKGDKPKAETGTEKKPSDTRRSF